RVAAIGDSLGRKSQEIRAFSPKPRSGGPGAPGPPLRDSNVSFTSVTWDLRPRLPHAVAARL
ncbi:MAG: hypothetical protein OES79_05965, partial [Planctomycetota bacterium]|nr:hypothetical protein [Planctomycetota bacterium]